jgi:hypothetical protein
MDAKHCAALRAFRSKLMSNNTQVLWMAGYEHILKSASFEAVL